MKYSKLQYFFWLISGSEISALKNCPNEYNRHANIGMMILITSMFAAFTAFIAGNTFVKNSLFGVICFAILWAILIFSIDRSMVNSIKRDPRESVQPFWSLFAPRLILAFILAFFMSIPLDHIVFHEKISRQMDENNQNDWLNRQEELNKGYDISRRDSNVTALGKEVDVLNEKLESGCPLPAYIQAKSDYENCTPKIKPLKDAFDKAVKERKAHYKVLQEQQDTTLPALDRTWFQLNDESKIANGAVLRQQNECEGYKKEAKRIDSIWQAGLTAEINHKDSLHQKQDSLLTADKDSSVIKATNFKLDIDSMRGFDTQFTTLFLMPNWGVQILKWLIFLALLVIEILPTYLKLRTPIGQYDWEMYRRDQMMANDVEAKIISEKEISEQTENHRKTKEIELNTTIIDKVAGIELDLANDTLEEWEKQAKNSVHQNVSNANQQNHTQRNPTIEDKLWKASNLQDEVFYLFKNGQPTNNELVYMESGKTHKGTWEYLTPNKEIKVNILNNIETYTIESITDVSVKLKATTNYYLELTKV